MERQMPGQRKGFLQAGEQLTRWWWLWLVAGALWIIASLIIIQAFHIRQQGQPHNTKAVS